MKPGLSFFGIPIGISILIWSTIGLIRYIYEKIIYSGLFEIIFGGEKIIYEKGKVLIFSKKDIAVIIPAHNEEIVIRRCIKALKKTLNAKQIHVISDGSADKTYRRARMEGCHVSNIYPGKGKAKGIIYAINRYDLYNKYKFIFIVDADTQIDKNFVKHALRLFRDPRIGVVFGSVKIRWPRHFRPRLPYYYIAYRERLSRLLQYFLTYGQTWVYTNVNYVTPGFATIYKTKILKQLEIDTPGLLIEDFNLAFQLHRKKLCKVGYSPSMIGWDQHPDNLRDYWNQVRRWNIGFFQTVRKNGVWPSFFWFTLALFSFEVILNSLFILILPAILLFLVFGLLAPYSPLANSLFQAYKSTGLFQNVTLWSIFFATFLVDYIFTVVIGIIGKKPQFIFYGLFFFFLHYVTSLILLSSFIPGFFGRSKGQWESPKRHLIGQQARV
jgi:poly-beta-1,6-N-acetyl-D-glucosamine synthase